MHRHTRIDTAHCMILLYFEAKTFIQTQVTQIHAHPEIHCLYVYKTILCILSPIVLRMNDTIHSHLQRYLLLFPSHSFAHASPARSFTVCFCRSYNSSFGVIFSVDFYV